MLNHRAILRIALPVMLSNVSTPLIGVVDTAIVGRIPDPAYIGAVALGALVFTFVFWAFGFLRMGTTGLTAQALGAGDGEELVAGLGRALLIAAVVGTVLIGLQWPIRELAFGLIEGSDRVEGLARDYFDIRIWAAPATLANYALLGWFIGMGRTDIGLVLQLVLNLANIALDAYFVLVLGLDVRGVALGTLLAEYLAVLVGLVVAIVHIRRNGARLSLARLLLADRLRRTLAVNRDIMIRSLALIFVFVWFMAQGARHGDVTLAANAVLMQFVSVSAYFLDGLAFAAEALVGRAVGARNRADFRAAVRLTTVWAVAVALLISVAFLLVGPWVVDALTTDSATRTAARDYLPWAALAPLAGVWAFQLDGIFIGATRSVEMRNAMLVSLAVFLLAWWLLQPWGNHGLWAALYVNYLARTLSLGWYYPALARFS
ncbi:MAG: MATE family efflux transporter [Azoarcus sp.]|nr:MATE family efflux transporter [Azoarcus sp.]